MYRARPISEVEINGYTLCATCDHPRSIHTFGPMCDHWDDKKPVNEKRCKCKKFT